MSIIKIIFKCLFVLVIGCNINYLHAQSSTSEYELKAAFLFNFTQFVNWPASSFSSPQSPMVIGIIGKDPFGSYLEQAIKGENVNGHPIIVQHYSSVEDINSCQILFINVNDKKKLTQIVTGLNKKNILTVGDKSDFLERGGMIKFLNKNNKIKLQVNLSATKEANLIISSKLLRLVDIVDSK